MKKNSLTLGLIQLFVAVMAIPSGLMMLYDTTGSLIGLPVDLLDGSPFKDYLIPGLFLFIVNGIGHLVAGILSLNNRLYSGILGIFFGAILIIWIIIQLYYTEGIVHFLQPLFFVIGGAEIVLGYLIAKDRKTVI
jgi:hypothetical protein